MGNSGEAAHRIVANSGGLGPILSSLHSGDEFGVSSSQGNGIFTGFERDRHVPDETATAAPSTTKDEVRASRDRSGQCRFARAVQGNLRKIVRMHSCYQ